MPRMHTNFPNVFSFELPMTKIVNTFYTLRLNTTKLVPQCTLLLKQGISNSTKYQEHERGSHHLRDLNQTTQTNKPPSLIYRYPWPKDSLL